MATRDPHRFVNELDDVSVMQLVSRLERRAQDAVFSRLAEKYAAKLALGSCGRLLEIGCGTGAVLRSLVRRPSFRGEAVGIDQSAIFVATASRIATHDRLNRKLRFEVGDAHHLPFAADEFDIAIAHTVVSHVTEPLDVIQEMARVVRPGGTVVFFDGDYASLTYGMPDHRLGSRMDSALACATFNNPRIMRELPSLMPSAGLALRDAWGDAITEIGTASYFKSFADTYVPYVHSAGLLPKQDIDTWWREQTNAIARGTFFAACNYYTYLASPC